MFLKTFCGVRSGFPGRQAGATAYTLALALAALLTLRAGAQGTFQNLDFETPSFIPIPGVSTVQWDAAMPGWTGYLGTNRIAWILHNDSSLSGAGISIYGPDYPSPNLFHGQYYLVLRNSFPVATDVPSITQAGAIPASARSIRFYTYRSIPTIGLSFGGQQLGLSLLGGSSSGYYTWAADVSSFAGRSGTLKLFGEGYLDYIQFSAEAIPEPRSLGLLAAGVVLLGWRFVGKSRQAGANRLRRGRSVHTEVSG